MKKKEGATNIAKLSVAQVAPPCLTTTARTSEFALECFHDLLHLPTPSPAFEMRQPKEWYAGVPLSFLIVLRNTRFQPLRGAVIRFEARADGRTICSEKREVEGQIDAQKWVTMSVNFVCRDKGTVELCTQASFTFDNNEHALKVVDVVSVKPSIFFKHTLRGKKPEMLQFQLHNMMPFTMVNVRAGGAQSDMFVCDALSPGEGVSAYFCPKTMLTKMDVSWQLPFATRCVQGVTIEGMREESENPIVLEILNLPEVGRCLQPFKVTVRMTNKSGEPVSGELVFNRSEQLILAVGPSNLRFENLVQQEFELTLVSLWQGAFPIPPFIINLNDGRSYVSDVNQGVIVIGYNE